MSYFVEPFPSGSIPQGQQANITKLRWPRVHASAAWDLSPRARGRTGSSLLSCGIPASRMLMLSGLHCRHSTQALILKCQKHVECPHSGPTASNRGHTACIVCCVCSGLCPYWGGTPVSYFCSDMGSFKAEGDR